MICRKQVIDIGANLARVLVPVVLPMAVDFPLRTGELVPVGGAPLLNRAVRFVQSLIRSEMRRRRDEARRRGREDDLSMARERSIQLDTDFEIDLAVEIDSNVPPGAGNLLRTDHVPDSAAGIG